MASEEALATQFKEAIPHTRGPQDISLFREAAPSVVLILAKDTLGSGSLLQDNVILTNFHVVKENGEVAIVFKPAAPNGKATEDEVVIADVVKIDVQRDLALVVRSQTTPFIRCRFPRRISTSVRMSVLLGIQKEKTGRIRKGSSVRSDLITNGQQVLAIHTGRP
jgi:Trypsin-like peptidase domain